MILKSDEVESHVMQSSLPSVGRYSRQIGWSSAALIRARLGTSTRCSGAVSLDRHTWRVKSCLVDPRDSATVTAHTGRVEACLSLPYLYRSSNR